MAATGINVAIRHNSRIFLASIMLMTVYLVARWTSDLLGVGTSIRPKRSFSWKVNQSRFVSLCLGNQMFSWAAMLYVAQLTGIHFRPLYTLGPLRISVCCRPCRANATTHCVQQEPVLAQLNYTVKQNALISKSRNACAIPIIRADFQK